MKIYENALRRCIFYNPQNPSAMNMVSKADKDLSRDGNAIFSLTQEIELCATDQVVVLAKAIFTRTRIWMALLHLPQAKEKIEESFEEFTKSERPSFVAAVRNERLGI